MTYLISAHCPGKLWYWNCSGGMLLFLLCTSLWLIGRDSGFGVRSPCMASSDLLPRLRLIILKLSKNVRSRSVSFSHSQNMPFTSALRGKYTHFRWPQGTHVIFFKSVLHPTSFLSPLLTSPTLQPRSTHLSSSGRPPSKFPRTAIRTKKYQF